MNLKCSCGHTLCLDEETIYTHYCIKYDDKLGYSKMRGLVYIKYSENKTFCEYSINPYPTRQTILAEIYNVFNQDVYSNFIQRAEKLKILL